MMRSMFSGATGLRNFQTMMDVIGNNISNVNTVGFKASRVSFQTTFAQVLKSAKFPSERTGGVNPMQVGVGSSIATIDKIMTQGAPQNTGKKTDLSIQGEGFFIVSDGTRLYFTRSGNFDLDENGTLVHSSTGLKVQGWIAEVDPKTGKRLIDTNNPVGDIVINSAIRMEARKTTLVDYEGNLKADVGMRSFKITLRDDSNNDHNLRIWFTRDEAISNVSDPFSDVQRYVVNIDLDEDGIVDGIGYVVLDKFGNVVDSGVRSSASLESGGPVTASGSSVTLNFAHTYTGRFEIILRNRTTGGVVTFVRDLTDANSVELSSPDLVDGDYDWEIRPIDLTVDSIENGTATVSGGSTTLNFTHTYTGDYRVVLKDSNGKIVYSSLMNLTDANSLNLTGLDLSDGDYTFELYQPLSSTFSIASGAELALTKTGQLKFYEADDPTNFYSPDYNFPKYVTSVQVYDTLGNAYTLYLEFLKLGYLDEKHKNVWIWRAYLPSGEPVKYVSGDGLTTLENTIGGAINFDENGRVIDYGSISGGKTENISFNPGDDVKYIAFSAEKNGDDIVKIKLDLSKITQFAGENSVAAVYQDGNALGTLESFSINEVGEIIGTFTNGKTDIIGQIALANFSNPAGLLNMGKTLYVESANSGLLRIGKPGTQDFGTLLPGTLEMSNVDLAEEFTKMIIAQRGFQANARVITTTDQILNELVNIKR